MTKKVLILDGHSEAGAFCGALAHTCAEEAQRAGHDTRLMRLSEMNFDPVHRRDGSGETEPDIAAVREAFAWCDHLILVHPLWWGSAPAKLKGLIDRTLLSGFAFEYEKGKHLPQKLLGGRSARLLVTSDTPSWYLRFVYGAGWFKIVRKQILGFCGFSPVRITNFGPVRSSTEKTRKKWLAEAARAGRLAA
ncbi:MAG: NAD(P)H-dependent oxidoreductase [Hyphomicrobiales bacterium]|nr:NAD(P)H-dependent oxidoreductase [Hyphomicrobiales bacterium]